MPTGLLPLLMRAMRASARAAARLPDVLLPGACVLCGGPAGSGQTCRECHEQVFGAASGAQRPRCRVCANPMPGAWHADEAPGARAAGSAAAAGAMATPGGAAAQRAAGSAAAAGTMATPGGAAAQRAAGRAAAAGSTAMPDGVAAQRAAAWPAVGSAVCGRCLAHPPAFDATVTAANYALPVDQLVLQLKFGGRLALAALCGRALADAALATPAFVRPALLCPVPLGPQRLAERGFNQALEIGRALAGRLDIALQPRLAARVHDTVAQSLVQPSARHANIAHAFTVPDGALVAGRHIGIVDDVMTSGQTLGELAATFKRYGAARVTCLVFARTPPH